MFFFCFIVFRTHLHLPFYTHKILQNNHLYLYHAFGNSIKLKASNQYHSFSLNEDFYMIEQCLFDFAKC